MRPNEGFMNFLKDENVSDLMTPEEMRALFKCKRSTIWRMTKAHEDPLPHIVLGPKKTRYPRKKVFEWIDRRTIAEH